MSGRGARTGRADLATRAETIRLPRIDKRAPLDLAEFTRQFERDTDLSLRSRCLWPYTGPDRWRPPVSGGIAYKDREGGRRS